MLCKYYILKHVIAFHCVTLNAWHFSISRQLSNLCTPFIAPIKLHVRCTPFCHIQQTSFIMSFERYLVTSQSPHSDLPSILPREVITVRSLVTSKGRHFVTSNTRHFVTSVARHFITSYILCTSSCHIQCT
jgi:hypothetical protein